MQKVIAQQLRLDDKTMAMFDEQDEEDDFNGVDLRSREAIRSVAVVIDKILRGSRFMMIFINGSDKEVGLGGADCTATRRWALFLNSVQVIDLYYTDWFEILSMEKIKLMANLMELNTEGVRWTQWISSHQIQKKLSNLQRLRINMSMYDEATETETSDTSDSFLLMDNTSLEILDLSGNNSNRVMGRNLAASISEAGRLQVLILHGCYGLGDVVLSNNSSLKSFSLDGYGPRESHLTSTVEIPPEIMSRPKQLPTYADKKNGAFKTNVVSLQGCGRLEKLFLRGLPNLVELDLSGCAINVHDFGSMVVDVPMLKRLFLIGCEHLRAIKWGLDDMQVAQKLQLMCIDTRSGSGKVLGCAHAPSLSAQHKSFRLQVHAIITDARQCRVERCPNLHAVFPPRTIDYKGMMETIWASDLLTARCVWGRGGIGDDSNHLARLQHLHLHCCPSFQFTLAMSRRPSFPSLKTLHIIHCGDLGHVFIPKDEKNKHTSVQFLKLTTIHLHDLPALRQICEGAMMLAPTLETIKIRGCSNLRQLPVLKGREARMKKPTVEMEKDVWDALEWDGVDAGHHPSLYDVPVHSRYYKKRMLRRTVLR
nr:unnamed protein product [Digitaria exilis]